LNLEVKTRFNGGSWFNVVDVNTVDCDELGRFGVGSGTKEGVGGWDEQLMVRM
jgi:hypothetical protein